MARLVKANAQVAYDDVALWYERDISHSGAERVALADSFTALDYMFGKMQWMLDGLQVYPAKMEHNLWRLEADSDCTLGAAQLDKIFDPWDFLTRIDVVFERLEELEF